MRTIEEIIATKVQRNPITGCWDWNGQKFGNGYGRYHRHNRKGGHVLAHRMIYEHFKGPIPVELDHLCRNRSCVNPDHLEPVDHRTNTLRGNSSPAQNARKTFCKAGHELNEANTYVTSRGWRQCRKCKSARQGQYIQRKVARAVEAYKKSLS